MPIFAHMQNSHWQVTGVASAQKAPSLIQEATLLINIQVQSVSHTVHYVSREDRQV